MTIGLIISSAYVSSGLMAEFGRLPPAMLPLGGRRLVMHQIAELQKITTRLFLSLPDDYALSSIDRAEVEREGVVILASPPQLSIGEAISNAINTIGVYSEPICVLYGDTLIAGLNDLPDDRCSVHPAHDLRDWARAEDFFPSQPDAVLSGLFSFSDVPLLLRALAASRGNFLNALHSYGTHRSLEPLSDGTWYDFGHVQTYHRSSGSFSTARAFNDVKVDGRVVEKFSRDRAKMDAEASWFENCPPALRGYLPAYLGRCKAGEQLGYRTSHTYLATLSSLAVYGRLNTQTWRQIFAACSRFLDAAANYSAPPEFDTNLDSYYTVKTAARLTDFARQGLIAVDRDLSLNGHPVPSAMKMNALTGEIITSRTPPKPSLIHGDFCFSNIFFDFRSDSIKVIDPRGMLPSGRVSIFGDPRYDLAKLAHSAQCGYDLIVAGRISCTQDNQALTLDLSATEEEGWIAMRTAFNESGIPQRTPDPALAAAFQVQLFLSMLPLHKDQPTRQRAFLAMAANQFQAIERG